MQSFRFLCAIVALFLLAACGGGSASAPETGGYEYPDDDFGYDDDYDYGYDCDDVVIEVDLVGVAQFKTFETDAPGMGDQVEFVFAFAVSAIGGDVAINTKCTEGDVTALAAFGSTYAITNSDSNITSANLSSDGDMLGEGLYLIQEGDVVVFTLTVTVTATADAFAQVSLLSIGWAPAYCPDESWLDIDLEGFESDPIFLDYFEEKG